MAPITNTDPTGADLAGIGMYFAGAVLVPLLIGVYVDSRFHTAPLWVLVGLFVGLAGGAAAVWLKVRELSKR
jgi:F0F1-type ATP synthase assembly protein I